MLAESFARSATDQRESERLKAKAAADLRRLWDAVERIRQMSDIYRERLDGNHRQ